MDGSKKATCKITVTVPAKKTTTKTTIKTEDKKNTEVNVTKINLTVETNKFAINQSYTIKATVSPSNAKNKTIKWASSNSEVVSVSSKGVIKILKAGIATITATASSGKKATLTVVSK